MWSPSEIALVITAVGGSAIAPALVKGVTGVLTGAFQTRRTREQALRTDLDACEEKCDELRGERDRSDSRARRLAEHASEIRRIALENGLRAEDFPRWPTD